MFPPLVTGLVILAIGLYLIPVAIKYAAGGAATFQMEAASFGSMMHWFAALTVVVVSLVCKFMGRGLVSSAGNFDRFSCRLCGCLGNGYGKFWRCRLKQDFSKYQQFSHMDSNLV
jgi:hypothetical protein